MHVLDPDAEAGEGGVAEPDVLQLVEESHGRLVAEAVVAVRDEDADLLLLELLVDEAQGGGDDVVEEGAAHRRLDDAAVPAQTDPRLEVDVLVVIRDAHLFGVGEEPPFTLGAGALLGQVVDAEDHVLGGNGHGGPVRGGQDVVGRQHQHLRLHLGLHGERHVHGHLVAVEVRVERGAHERVDLDGLALDQDGLEGLDAQAVERRRAVQEHRMLGDHFFQDVPDLRPLLLHELLGRLDGGGDAPLLELAKDEGLEELEGHLLGQPALVELEVGADHDDGAPGIVHPLAEQVLAEAALLALQGVGQGLEGPVVRPRDNAAAAAVVEEGVHRFLQHPLLVADDDLGRAQLHEALEPVVAVDHAPVEVVEVRGGEAAAVERHEGPQLGRDDGQDFQDHPLRLVARLQERLDHLQALDDLLPLLGRGLHAHPGTKLTGQHVHVDLTQQLADGLGAHPHREGVVAVLLLELPGLVHGHEVLLLEPGNLPRLEDDVLLEVQDLLQLPQRHVEELADARGQALEEPHVRDGGGELDVAHPLPAHPGPRHLHAALVADHARELHSLVFPAGALVVLGGPEDAGAEEAVPLGLERPVVDGLRLLDLAVRPVADLLRRRQLDTDGAERHGLRVPIENPPQVLRGLLFPNQAAECPIRQHSVDLL